MGNARAFGAVALLALGCSTTATVTHRNGAEVEGNIKGGTPYGVVVETEDGRLEEIPRDDITEIDHPGNVHALLGGLAIGLGGMMFLEQSERCDVNYSSDCWSFMIPVAVGAPLMIWGISTWKSSESAAGKSSLKPLHPEYGRPPPRSGNPAPNVELPPPSPAPPGYVGPAAAPAPAPTPTAPASTSPPPEPPAEPEPGGIVW